MSARTSDPLRHTAEPRLGLLRDKRFGRRRWCAIAAVVALVGSTWFLLPRSQEQPHPVPHELDELAAAVERSPVARHTT